MLKSTPVDDPSYDKAVSLLSKLEGIATMINDNKRRFENISRLLDIQNRLNSNTQVAGADRWSSRHPRWQLHTTPSAAPAAGGDRRRHALDQLILGASSSPTPRSRTDHQHQGATMCFDIDS